MALLLVCKITYTEARILFYLHHTFRFACGNPSFGQSTTNDLSTPDSYYHSLDWMTKIELTNCSHYFPKEESHVSVHRQLCLLDEFCSRLKSLKVDYHLSQEERYPPTVNTCGLWARSVEIEIRFTFSWRASEETMGKFLNAIAAREGWRKVGVVGLEGYDFEPETGEKVCFRGLPQYTYRLDRCMKGRIGVSASGYSSCLDL